MNVAPSIIACCRVSRQEEDIFRFWLEHYQPHVDIIAVVIIAEKRDEILDIKERCEKARVRYSICEMERFHTWHSMEALQNLVGQINAAWVLHADSDEFLREIREIRGITGEMIAENADHAFAWMRDRLAVEGHLRSIKDLNTVPELCAAFPVEAAVTSRLAKACAFKVCLSKWPETGLIHSKGRRLTRQIPRMLTLDHFKWRAGLIERLQKRVEDHSAGGLPWGDESRRILKELTDHGRIRSHLWQTDKPG
jgi:hypothetical protein